MNSKAPDLHRVRRIGEKDEGRRKGKKREEEEGRKKKEGPGKERKNLILMASVPIPQGPLPLSSLILNLREISNCNDHLSSLHDLLQSSFKFRCCKLRLGEFILQITLSCSCKKKDLRAQKKEKKKEKMPAPCYSSSAPESWEGELDETGKSQALQQAPHSSVFL